jgi:hypothetical protein
MAYTLWADTFAPLRDRLDRHSGIAFALQELQGGFDDASAGVACLAPANQ